MAQAHLEVFQSEFHMLQFFGKYLPKLDVNASGRLAPFLYCYDNELVLARNLYEFLTQIEKMTALGIDTLASTQKGTAFLVFFHDKPKSADTFLASVKEIEASRENIIPKDDNDEQIDEALSSLVQTTVIEVVEEVKPESDEIVVEENPAEEVEDVAVSDTNKDEILAQAEALRDDSKKAAAKAALEAFALTHNVSLSKAKTFDAMLEDLKAAL